MLDDCRAKSAQIFADCTYFFAGKVYPDIVKPFIVFVYGADIEKNVPGSVSPFDTGGLWTGKMYPYREESETDRHDMACQLIADTAVDMQEWRAAFTVFLADFFNGNTQRYLARTPPSPASSLQGRWHEKLPARLSKNWNGMVKDSHIRESRAWTWEIRLHQSIPLVNEQLIFAAANPVAADALRKWVITQKRQLSGHGLSGYSSSTAKRRAIEMAAKLVRTLHPSQQGVVPSAQYEFIGHVEKKIASL
ncbi:MAG: hypothetical protein H7836_15820 [Magnetococcus sp. YQC-3]